MSDAVDTTDMRRGPDYEDTCEIPVTKCRIGRYILTFVTGGAQSWGGEGGGGRVLVYEEEEIVDTARSQRGVWG